MRSKIILLLAINATLLLSCAKERYIKDPGNLVPKTVDEDSSLPAININGAKIHAEAFGNPDSTIVVFIHGGPGGDYRSLLNGKQLANHGYRVVFYDQRGSGLSQRFGKSSYTNNGMGAIDVLYEELSGVINHYRKNPGQKVFLVGHSWGAILATGYAAKYPNQIQGFVAAEPGAFKWNDIKEYIKKSNQFNLWGEVLNDAAFLDQFISGKTDQHAILDYKHALLAASDFEVGVNNPVPAKFWRSGAVMNIAMFEIADRHQPDFSAGISNFNVPVLFLYSEKNEAYPLSWAQKISAVFNIAEIKKIPGTGHKGIFSDDYAFNNHTLPVILNYFKTL